MIDRGGVMVVGATSGAGKSTVTAGLCRSLARSGRRVAPFKAQNMSNHAAVTADGGEVGRAQAMQALAAGVDIERRMNPILLKPTSDLRSHLVVMGDEVSVTDAADYAAVTAGLRATVLDAITSLREDHHWVVAEGAGGAAEINLLDRDLVNLPLARAAGLPAILVVDIERGGAFASAYGSIELLPPELRATLAGVVFNQFRGDPSLLDTGVRSLEERTGVPYLGTLPHLGRLPMLGVEDSLDLQRTVGRFNGPGDPGQSLRPLRVAAIQLPHLANPFDLDPVAVERDVEFRWITRADEIAAADLVVLPGSRATVDDLTWMHSTGLAAALAATSATVVGICAGFQMLGSVIHDDVESDAGSIKGLDVLDVTTQFERPKLVQRRRASAGPLTVDGYDIRFGRPTAGALPWFTSIDESRDPEGARSPDGRVFGTSLHGLFDNDDFRRAFLGEVAERRGRSFEPSGPGWKSRLDEFHDALADWLEQHLDIDTVVDIGRTANGGAGW